MLGVCCAGVLDDGTAVPKHIVLPDLFYVENVIETEICHKFESVAVISGPCITRRMFAFLSQVLHLPFSC